MERLKWYIKSPSVLTGLFYLTIGRFDYYRVSKKVSKTLRRVLEHSRLTQKEETEEGYNLFYPDCEIKADDYNYYITFWMLPGQTTKEWEGKATAFSNALAGDLVKYEIKRGKVELVVQYEDMKTDQVLYKEDDQHYLNLGYKPGGILTWDYDENPHMLVIGVTGSGKSTFIRNLLIQIPADRIRIVDGKQVEFDFLRKYGYYVVTEVKDFLRYVDDATEEMEKRYREMKRHGKNHYSEMDMRPYFLLVDEFISLVESLKKKPAKGEDKSERDILFEKLFKLSTKGRAAGVFMILILQRPDSNFMPTAVRDNLTCKVVLKGSQTAFKMAFDDEGKSLEVLPKGQGYCGIDGSITNFCFPNYSQDQLERDLEREQAREVNENAVPDLILREV